MNYVYGGVGGRVYTNASLGLLDSPLSDFSNAPYASSLLRGLLHIVKVFSRPALHQLTTVRKLAQYQNGKLLGWGSACLCELNGVGVLCGSYQKLYFCFDSEVKHYSPKKWRPSLVSLRIVEASLRTLSEKVSPLALPGTCDVMAL